MNTCVCCVCTPPRGAGRQCRDQSPTQYWNTARTAALKCLPFSFSVRVECGQGHPRVSIWPSGRSVSGLQPGLWDAVLARHPYLRPGALTLPPPLSGGGRDAGWAGLTVSAPPAAPASASPGPQLCPRASSLGHLAVLMTGRGGAGACAGSARVFTPARLWGRSRAPQQAVLLQGLGGSEVGRLGPRARALGSACGQNLSSLGVTHPLLLGHQPRVPILEEEWSPYPGVMHRNSGTPGSKHKANLPPQTHLHLLFKKNF